MNSTRQEERNQRTPQFNTQALSVPDGATSVVYSIGFAQSRHVRYIVDEPFPSDETLAHISSTLKAEGWQPLEEDWMNPGEPSSHVEGWIEFTETRTPKSPEHVYQWMAQWQDSDGNVVAYSLHVYASQPGKTAVNGVWCPAASVEVMSNSGSAELE